MTKLFVVSKPLNNDVGDLLKVVGIDRRTTVIVIGLDIDGSSCSRYICLDALTGFDTIAKSIVDIARNRSISYIRFILGDSDALTSTAIHTLYTVFSTIEVFSGIEVEPLNLVYRDELVKLDFKPRLWLDPRDLKILSGLGRCRVSGDIAEELGIPRSSARRRLSNMSRKGLLDTMCLGRTKVYCPTTLAKMFSYTLTQILL